MFGCQDGACIFGCPGGTGVGHTYVAGDVLPCETCEPSAATESDYGFVSFAVGTPCDGGMPGVWECMGFDCELVP